MSSVRRVYYYLVCLITLGIFAAGVGVLLSLVFDLVFSNTAAIGETNFIQQQLSLGLAMLVIGGPLWFFFWRNIQKHVSGNTAEIGASLRKLFLNFILTVTAISSIFALKTVLTWLLSGTPEFESSSGSLATFIVTSIVWFFHWRVSEGEGHPSSSAKTLRRWYIYIVSGWGLVLLSLSLIQFVNYSSRFLPFWGSSLVASGYWNESIVSSISMAVCSGLLWAFHWFRMAKGDVDSILRQVYIYLLAIIVSSISGLVSLTVGLYHTLVWAMGAAGNIEGSYFQFLCWVIPTLAVTAAVWTYHQKIAQEESASLHERLLSSKRIHLYIMSFIGLGTLTSGLIILFGTILSVIINVLNPDIVIQSGWWQKQLSLSLSLLLVALPIWLFYWNQIVRLAADGGIVEWRARSRRIYLYVVIGASIIALAAVFVNIIYQILSGALTGNFGVEVLQKSRWSLQALLVAVPLLVYHWQIARKDQRRGAEAAAVRKVITALVQNQSGDIITRLENMLSVRIRVLEFVGTAETQTIPDEILDRAVNEINASPSPKVFLLIRGNEIQVFPYQE
jgi:hypothetical protein